MNPGYMDPAAWWLASFAAVALLAVILLAVCEIRDRRAG